MSERTPRPGAAGPPWSVVIPIKAPDRGKSRIAVDPAARAEIAAALAFDTVSAVAAARRVDRVIIVTDGAGTLGWIDELPQGREKVWVVPSSATTLNGSIRDGLAGVRGAAAVLPGDLPGLRAEELDEVLEHLTAPVSVVPDADGVGTTLLAALWAADLDPEYGPDSFRRHLTGGAREIVLPVEHWLRRDVDTVDDLAGIHTGRTAVSAAALGSRDAVRCGGGTAARC
ncbi:MAG: 2-phospho-L-lactate guanylyltransferase [Nakamurella sp.]